MATFKAVVLKHQVHIDKTVRIKIKVTHNRIRKFIDTGLVATTSDITKSGKIKTQAFIDATNDTIKLYHEKCNRHPEKVSKMDCAELVEFITRPEPTMDFIKFADNHIKLMRENGRAKSASDYQSAINALKRYMGCDYLAVNEINVKFLQAFCTWLPLNPVNKNNKRHTMQRAPSHYLGSIRTLHNEMKLQYNDEDNCVIPIPGSPFARFKVPKSPVTKKRAISPADIKKIYELNYMEPKRGSGSRSFNLAKDCFLLSFFLMGMNSADLFDCTEIKNNTITYYRKKTRDRRDDHAEMQVTIQPEITPLVEKYRDPAGKRVFNFYTEYKNESNFNRAINLGLKNILPGLQFYSARHSWATIALNNCGIDKYLVHECLVHTEQSMKTTDVYLMKDYSRINNANRKVIDLIFKDVKKSGVKRVKTSL